MVRRALLLLLGTSLLDISAAAKDKKPPHGPLEMEAVVNGNTLVPVQAELARWETAQRPGSISQVGGPRSTMNVVRIEHGKANIRYSQGQQVVFVQSLSGQLKPDEFELWRFNSTGNMRETEAGPWNDPMRTRWNTLGFRGAKTRDGRWALIASDLEPGEYCFALRNGDDNYCFGVDKKP